MFPSMLHRLVILTAVILGSLGWLFAGPSLVAPDGSSGISLFDARVGVIVASALVGVAALPAAGLGVIASMMGNPLAGVFSFGIALAVLAWWGGPMSGWIDRSALPGGYWSLLGEAVMWQLGLMVLFAVIQRLRDPLRTRWPALAFHDHLGGNLAMRLPRLTALAAGAVSVLVSGVVGFFLLRSTDNGQVVFSLLIAFTLGGMTGQLLFPQDNPVGVLLSPAVVAIAAYAFVATQFGTREEVLAGMYQSTLPSMQRVPGLALALPIHYASAGLAGAAAGVGLAQVFAHGEHAPASEPA